MSTVDEMRDRESLALELYEVKSRLQELEQQTEARLVALEATVMARLAALEKDVYARLAVLEQGTESRLEAHESSSTERYQAVVSALRDITDDPCLIERLAEIDAGGKPTIH